MRITLLFTVVLLVLGPVRAQTTVISNLSYPAVDVGQNNVVVSFDVAYSKAPLEGGYLLAGVWDYDGNDYAARWLPAALPDSACYGGYGVSDPAYIALMTTVDSSAICIVRTGPLAPSGVRSFQFDMWLLSPLPQYKFHAFATWLDKDVKPISNSTIIAPFAIDLKLLVTIGAPAGIPITVDGESASPGDFALDFSPHYVSVPEFVNINSTSRLRFTGWNDGVASTERSLNSKLTSFQNQSYTANYVKQYLLNVTSSQSGVEGAGWYDEGSNATFNVKSDVTRMGGVLGALGGVWRFQGWFEGEQLVQGSKEGSVLMNAPHSLTIHWQPDYSLPMVSFGVMIAVTIGLIVVAVRRRSKPND
jgi:hypothetical protein